MIGETCFSVAIHAGSPEAAVDWRADYDALSYEPIELPEQVRSGIMAFMRHFRLVFAAFDFGIRPLGEWVMYEANSGAQFGWIEAATGLPISDALATLLAEGPAPR